MKIFGSESQSTEFELIEFESMDDVDEAIADRDYL